MGQGAHVAGQANGLGDAVGLDAAPDHGGGHRHAGKGAQNRSEPRVFRLRVGNDLVDVLRRRLILDGEGGQVIEQAGGGVPLRFVLFDALDYLGQPVQSVGPLPGSRRVGAGPLDIYLDLQAALLAHAQDVGQRSRRLDGRAAALVDRQGRGQLFRMFLSHPAKPVPAAVLLIGAGDQYQAVLELNAVALEHAHGHQLAGQQRLAVVGAPAVDPAIGDGGAEGGEPPLLLFFHRHHVQMGHEKQACVFRASFQTRDQVAPSGGRLQYLRADAVLGQPVPGVFRHRRLVAGGHDSRIHRWDPDQRLLQRQDLVLGGIYLVE